MHVLLKDSVLALRDTSVTIFHHISVTLAYSLCAIALAHAALRKVAMVGISLDTLISSRQIQILLYFNLSQVLY